MDRIRLETAYVAGYELYGWPAGERIAEDDLRRLVGGTITNGDFALVTRALFAGPGVTFRNVSVQASSGAATGEFSSLRESSEWVLAFENHESPVGYFGSFRADAASHRLLSLEMTAEYIPREFGYLKVRRSLEFEPVRIGSQEFLIPSRAELTTIGRNNEENRNETRFSNCRQYGAESVVRFEGDAKAAGATQPENAPARALPEEFEASCELETPVDSDSSAVGDPVTALIQKSIAGQNGFEIPKGARLRGRIGRLDVADGRRTAEFVFRSIEWNGRVTSLEGRINRLIVLGKRISGSQRASNAQWSPQSPVIETTTSSQIQSFGKHLVVPIGFQFKLDSRRSGS